MAPVAILFINKIYLGPANYAIQFGLPTFMQSYFDSTSNPYDFNGTGNCFDPECIIYHQQAQWY